MDYEKKYKEALEKAQKFYNNSVAITKKGLEDIFPALKESEDEIRKAVIDAVETLSDSPLKVKMLAWLEKQGEHKKFRDSIQVGDKVTRNEDGVLVNLSQLNRVAKKNEQQGEQNLIKIPKFKSGDTIKFNGLGHNRYTIKEVCGTSHYINSNGGGMDMSYTDANFELVEQKPVLDIEIPFGVKDSELKEVTYDIPKGYHAEIEDNKVVIKKGEKKPVEWSEEDEKMLEQCCVAITDSYFNKIAKGQILIDWLKSLRPQKQWKPSEKQMEALLGVKAIMTMPHRNYSEGEIKAIESLYNDLKQLKAL